MTSGEEMRPIRTVATSVAPAAIAEAQGGDPRALDEVVRVFLSLAYTIAHRALGDHPDVDDVVQEVMLRALRQLPTLREPECFRPWLATIAIHQVSTYLRQRDSAAVHRAAPDDVARASAPADVEGLAVFHAELSGQRRQVMRASQWLDADDRALLSLWWLETAGELSRAELATALRISSAHAAVRVQRMRSRLDLCRDVVAALSAAPGCCGLEATLAGWDTAPSPLWRKRITRHIRSCSRCADASDGMIAAERLIPGYALLPVPVALTAALAAKSLVSGAGTAAATTIAADAGLAGGTVNIGLLGQFVHVAAVHPAIAAAVTAAVLAAGATVAVTQLSASAGTAPPAVAAASTPSAGPSSGTSVTGALS